MSLAIQLSQLVFSKYESPEKFERTFTDVEHCKYSIKFIDGSSLDVVMTTRQRDMLHRTSFYQYIDKIGGLGYQKRVSQC